MFVGKEIKRVAVVSEGVCPEDPHGVDKQVALFPADASLVAQTGVQVSVQRGAGAKIGKSDAEYQRFGVQLEDRDTIYRGKDLVIKIKGPTDDAANELDRGSTLLCMAHLPMYPSRREILKSRQVNVVAMEAVAEPSRALDIDAYTPRLFAKEIFDKQLKDIPAVGRNVVVVGYSKVTDEIIRYFGRKQLASLLVVPASGVTSWIAKAAPGTVVVGAVDSAPDSAMTLRKASEHENLIVADFRDYKVSTKDFLRIARLSQEEMEARPQRSIQCLHETGRAGAQFGIEGVDRDGPKAWTERDLALVLGYGNVAMGAIDQCLQQGQSVYVLGRFNTRKDRIEPWLARSKLVINGAFIPDELAGIEYVLNNHHVDNVMRNGTMLIDLIGGSPTDRSPVEPVETCTFLGEPMFERNGIRIASVFAWPNFYRTEATNSQYSRQIMNVLTRPNGLLSGLAKADEGIRKAIVLGPFEKND